MTRVGQSDHVLVLLREKLQRIDRSRSGRTSRTGSAEKGTLPPLARLQERAAGDDPPDEEFRRTLVRAVLTEELGEKIGNDPNFQAIAEDVFRILNDSDTGRDLMERAALHLRQPG